MIETATIPSEWALLYMSMATYVFPFSLIGFWNGIKWITEKIKVKNGHIKCIFRTKNFRKRVKFMRPEDGIIQEKGTGDKYKTLNCPTDPGYIYFEGALGATPVIEYDANRMPINFLPDSATNQATQAEVDSVMLRVFNLGQKFGLKDLDKIKMISLIGVMASIVTLATLLMLISGNLQIGSLALH